MPMDWVNGTGDLGIVKNNKLRVVLLKGPKYGEQRYFTWKQNSHLMDSVEEYARQWAKLEDVEAETLSEWLKAKMSLVNRCILILCKNMSNRYKSMTYLVSLPNYVTSRRNLLPFQLTKRRTILYLSVRHTIFTAW